MITRIFELIEKWIENRHERWRVQHERSIIIEEENVKLEAERMKCESCESLRMQVNQLIRDNEFLKEQLFKKPEPQAMPANRPISKSLNVPWRVKQAELEADSRKQAQTLRENKEKELLTTEFPPVSARIDNIGVTETTELEKEILMSRVKQ